MQTDKSGQRIDSEADRQKESVAHIPTHTLISLQLMSQLGSGSECEE